MTPKECYIRAGNIHSEVCKKIYHEIKHGQSLLSIAQKIESLIQAYPKTSLAFPVNLQLNNIVHYSPTPDDATIVQEGDILKVDIGIHVNGFIADGAFTLSFNKDYDEMVEFTKDTLQISLKGLKPGMKVSEIGRRLDECLKGSKHKIIKNLMGHQVQQWELHSTKSVPVYEISTNQNILSLGEAFAIEIFITDGDGWIRSSDKSVIFAIKDPNILVRDPTIRRIVKDIYDRRRSLPFTERYIIDHLKYSKLNFFQLRKSGVLYEYPILVENEKSKVAQFEDVIYVDEKEVIITTQPQV